MSTQQGGTSPKIAKVKDLALQLRAHRRQRVRWGDPEASGSAFLVGAGCSRSAGIKLASEIAYDNICQLAQSLGAPPADRGTPEAALEWLKADQENYFKADCDFNSAYNVMFEHYYTSGKIQREIIQTVISQANDNINWAHICLGQLVHKHYVHTVLTTNFDQLVSRGIIYTGEFPIIADGVESMDRLDPTPRFPQVVHLHGSMHTYRPRNGSSAVKAAGDFAAMRGTIWNTCRGADMLVVVGYAGREEGVVDVLAEVVNELPQTIIYWITYEADDSGLSRKVREILSGPNKYWIPGQDADVFFAELLRMMDEPIDWMENPLQTLLDRKIELSDRKEWASELQRDNINTLRTIYGRRLAKMAAAGVLTGIEEAVRKAATASQSGNDEEVISLLEGLDADEDLRIAPLLSLSLFRTGDRLRDESRILKSIELAERHITSAPEDFSTLSLLGDAYSALADLLDGRRDQSDEVGANREKAVKFHMEALNKTPTDNHKGRQLAVEKFAVSVSESGSEGGTAEAVGAAIAEIDRLLNDTVNELSRMERAELLDRSAMLRLILAARSNQRADFLDALRASDQALEIVNGELSTMTAVGMLRNNASAHRGLGTHLTTSGSPEEGRRELRRAAELYQRAGEAYSAGVEDAEPADYKDAARKAFVEARDVFTAIGLGEMAEHVQALVDRFSAGSSNIGDSL